MAFKTSEKYKNVIYSGDCRHKLKLLFNGVELADADVYCESLKVTSRILPNGSTRFSLDNFIAKEAEIILHDIDTTIIQSPVNISIGTLVDGTYEYVPIGLFVVQDLPTTDKNKTTIKLRDYAVKFDFGYNAKDIIDANGGSATLLQVLQDICSKAGVETDIAKFYGCNSRIGIYDNTITGRAYISYLAEQAGSIATIDRSGKLIFVQLKDLETVEIPLNIVEKYEDGEKYEISRVVYEDAIRKFEYGDETKDTLFINSANPYIDNEVLTNIETGTQIETSDSSDNEVVNYKQYGYTKQNVYSGRQLYDINDYTGTQTTPKDKDDWITITYDNTEGTKVKYVNYMTLPSQKLKPNTQYAVFVEVKEVSGNAYINICGDQTNSQAQFNGYTLQFSSTTPGIYKKILTTKTDFTSTVSMLRTFATFREGISGSITFRLSVIEDTSVSVDNFKYEPYVGGKASPSPDYPQEVEVGKGVNLLNPIGPSREISGLIFTNNGDGSFTLKGTSTEDRSFSLTYLDTYPIYFKKGEYYTQSLNVISGKMEGSIVPAVINSEGVITYNYLSCSNGYLTSTKLVEEDLKVNGYTHYIAKGKTVDVTYKVQLEKGKVKTAWKPYNTIEAKSIGKNILENSSFRENYDKWSPMGDAEMTEKFGQKCMHIKSSLSLTRTTMQDISKKVKPGEIYTVSCYVYVENFNVGTTNPYFSIYFDGRKLDGSWVGAYRVKGNASFSGYDYSNGFVKLTYTLQIPADVDLTKNYGIYIYTRDVDADLYFYDLQMEPGDVDTDYQEYQESSIQYHLEDNFLADKDYIENGALNKNIGKVVLNGDENGWRLYKTTNNGYKYALNGWANSLDKTHHYTDATNYYTCSHFLFSNKDTDDMDNGLFVVHKTSGSHWIFFTSNISSVDQWKTWLKENSVTVYYELETPEQIPLETTGELRTFESNTIITNDLDSEMEIEYKMNRTQVSQILELNKNISINSFKTGKIIGNPAIDAYDIIKIIDGNKEFKTLATNDLTYNGVMINTFDTQIGKEAKKENVTLTPEATFKKWAKTEIDNVEAEVRINTGKIETVVDEMGNMYTKGQVNELIANAETGVTNTFSEAGGNNVFRNTGLWFVNSGEDAETNPYEFWEGKVNEGSNDKATNYRSILLGKGSFIQDVTEVPNGNYSVSFYYRKLISNAVASVVINDKEYILDSLETKQFYTGEQNSETGEYIVDPIVVSNNHIKIEFKCDALDGVEVYDLMCNKGSVKLAYSQNQNETTTDTVNISKGITITSSLEENTKFKADYDGIRILDGQNNVKTNFTDKGAETDELIVRKKATITGLLHQEVDDQTWVTKI